MKKIEELFETLSDPQLIIDGLKTIEVEAINKYWLSGKLQQPKGEDLSTSEIKRLLLIAFAPDDSLPAAQRNAPRLKTCNSFFRFRRSSFGKQKGGYNKDAFDPQGEFTYTKDFDALPLNFYSDIFQALQTKKVIIAPESLQSHFLTGKLVWLKGIKELEIVALGDSLNLTVGPSPMQALPEDIGELIDLETLIIERSDISILPDSFYKLRNLKFLHLASNKLSTLSEKIAQLVSLEALDISYNQIERVPSSLSLLKNLKKIIVAANPFKEISDDITFEINITSRKEKIAFTEPAQFWHDYPKNILVLSEYWIEIPMTRIEEIITKNGISKLAIYSEEMLKKVLHSDNIQHFQKINCLLLPKLINEWGHDRSNIKEIPESIEQMNWLEEVQLTDRISKLPESFFNLKNLKRLSLNGDEMELPIPNLFSSFSELTHLELRLPPANEGKPPESIYSLKNLVYMDLSWNKNITELSPQIGNLENLEELNMENNALSMLPNEFDRLKKLKRLNLQQNDLTSFPEALLNLSSLEELNLSVQKITELPKNLAGLKNLKILNLKSNELQTVPDSIGNLISLENLDLEYNKITSISEEIKNCSKLKSLYLTSNKLLHKLPDALVDLTNLEDLNINSCELIKSLPVELFHLKSLVELKLFNVPITNLSSAIKNLENLEYLDLRLTKITEFPTEIGELKKLTKIDGCTLNKALPDSFCNLINLKELNINFENVENPFPEKFGELVSLEKLITYPKNMNQLPESFVDLKNLKTLEIRFSSMKKFPLVLTKLQNIEHLSLMDNSFVDVPYELTKLKTLTSVSFEYNPMSHSVQRKCKALLPGVDFLF